MKRFPFKKTDAFATERSDGNPAGIVIADSLTDISEQEMQQIARELKGTVSEVVYISQISDNGYELKYYSSEREVDFCGHATIAVMYDMLKHNAYLQQFEAIILKTNRGLLKAWNHIKDEDAVFILAPVPYENTITPDILAIAKALRIEPEEINTFLPISVINAGLTTLFIPIQNLHSILRISPDKEELKEFCIQMGIDIIEVFTEEVSNPYNDFRVRVFAPTFGYLEDPATGSGNAAFGHYLLQQGLWKNETIIIEQNGEKEHFNIVKLKRQEDENGNYRILFGGNAITRFEGEYLLYI